MNILEFSSILLFLVAGAASMNSAAVAVLLVLLSVILGYSSLSNSLHGFASCLEIIEPQTEEDVGLLVQVSFYITAFTLPAYQRGSLPRPSKDVSS